MTTSGWIKSAKKESHNLKSREKSPKSHKSEDESSIPHRSKKTSSESENPKKISSKSESKAEFNQYKNLEYSPSISPGLVKEKKPYNGLDQVQCYRCLSFSHLARNCKVNLSVQLVQLRKHRLQC